MYNYGNEDAAWERLKDIQREVENSRLLATNGVPTTLHILRLLAERMWWIAGLAMRRAPRRHRAGRIQDAERARDAA